MQNVKSMKTDCNLHKDAKVTSEKRECQYHINEERKGSFPSISTVFLVNLLCGQNVVRKQISEIPLLPVGQRY